MKSSIFLGRIAGIRIGIHYTWLLALAFITWTLAVTFFPDVYPGLSTSTYWIIGAVSALLLFVSVLVHEISHSLVARSRGMGVDSITLFIFGGVSNITGEVKRPRDEFFIAIVGPLTSAVLAGVFYLAYRVTGPGDRAYSAVLAYLSLINGVLAVFNLIPGFPLDGGRVLRSAVWGITGSMVKATNVAVVLGRLVGWGLIAFGIFTFLRGDILGGIWTAFIGWFLNSAAESSKLDATYQQVMNNVKVGQVMDPEPIAVQPGTTVDEMVKEYFLRRGKRAVPVVYGDRVLGIVTLSDIKGLPRDRWPTTAVSEVMTRTPLYSVLPDDQLAQAMRLMSEHDIHQLPVMDNEKLVGIVDRAHVMRYIEGARELGISPGRSPSGPQRGQPGVGPETTSR